MLKLSLKRKYQIQYSTLVIPGLIIFTIGLILPLFLGLYYSFTSWDGFTKEKAWVGFNNYFKMFTDQNGLNAWAFTILFTIANTVFQNIFALLFAIILDSNIKLKKLYRTLLFLPCLIAPIVAGFIWLHIFSDVLPAINDLFGSNINFALLSDSDSVLSGLLIINNWQWIGYWMLIYLAALQAIPKDYYEAARVDGASSLRQFRAITIPMLAPAFTICIVGITVGSLKVYDLLVSSTHGGPGHSSTSIIYYIYNTAINEKQYGYGSAVSVTLILVLLVIAFIQIKALRKNEVQL